MGIDVHITPQVLRRTYNTLLRPITDPTTRHALIGHSDERINELYTHVSYEKKVAAVARFEELIATAGG